MVVMAKKDVPPPGNPEDAPAPKRGRGRPRKERTPEEIAAMEPNRRPGMEWQKQKYWAEVDKQDLEIRNGTRKRRSNIPIPEYWLDPKSTYQRRQAAARSNFPTDRTFLNAKDRETVGHTHSWSLHKTINFLKEDHRDSHFQTIQVPNDGSTTTKMRNYLGAKKAEAEYASGGSHRFETVEASPGVFNMYKTPTKCPKCVG